MDENKITDKNEEIHDENKRGVGWYLWKRFVWKLERHPMSVVWTGFVLYTAIGTCVTQDGGFGTFLFIVIFGLIVKGICRWLFHPEQLKPSNIAREQRQYEEYIQEQIEKENQKRIK